MEVGSVKKYVSVAMRNCYRLASRHPLLTFMVLFLIWLNLTFPLLFSLLVYSSPVIASTSFLLGTLLYYGHKNAPEIRKEAKPLHHEIYNPKATAMGDNTEIGEMDVRSETSEKSFRRKPFVVNNMNLRNKKVNRAPKSEAKVILVHRSPQFQPYQPKNTGLRSSANNLRGYSSDHSKAVYNKGWETGSEVAESLSPTSMADMFPNELHPLLQPPQVPHIIASDHSLETDEDDEDDRDEEDMEEEEEEDVDENVITWTEDDQKNMINLGTSELERNQRLESLIARQKALKNMRMLAEKNMVNINPDLPLNTASISTASKNTFDLPYNNSNQNSAPSVIMPRRNPFDLPYDSKPGSSSQSRRQSFDVGESSTVRPYFVPDGNNYSSTHNRQMGEVSDTESINTDHTEDEHHSHLASVKQGYYTSEVSQKNRSSDVNYNLKIPQVKTSVGNVTGNQGKSRSSSSSSAFSDVTDHIDDEEDDEFGSAVMPLTPESKKLQFQEQAKETLQNTKSSSTADSRVDDSESKSDKVKQDDQTENEGRLPQKLTSWFGWKG